MKFTTQMFDITSKDDALLVKMVLCSKLDCTKVLNLNFSYKIFSIA